MFWMDSAVPSEVPPNFMMIIVVGSALETPENSQ